MNQVNLQIPDAQKATAGLRDRAPELGEGYAVSRLRLGSAAARGRDLRPAASEF
jgi:hypothetical protein